MSPSSLEFRSLGLGHGADGDGFGASEDADGAVDEATVEHTVSGGDYGSETASDVAVTVRENETASTTVTLTASPVTVAEDAGATPVMVTAELDAAPRAVATVVTVAVGAGGDSAVAGTDYGPVDDFTVTIPAGATSEFGELRADAGGRRGRRRRRDGDGGRLGDGSDGDRHGGQRSRTTTRGGWR